MDSLNSCFQNQEEESGWTAYFEDFSDQQESYSSSHGTSMVSDAASRAEPTNILKKLRLKKTRTKEIWHDDSLEDTASSPANSPKVSDAMKPTDHTMNPRTKEDHRINISLGKRFEPGVLDQMDQTRSDDEDHDRHKMKYNTDKDDRLKKKGLCLVPMSMLVNYFG